MVLYDQGDDDGAITMARQCAEISEMTLGAEHEYTVNAKGLLETLEHQRSEQLARDVEERVS